MVRADPLDPVQEAGIAVMPYLEKAEIDALLAAPDRQTAQGRRDCALLLFLCNAGARATEAAQLKVRDLDIRASCLKITGKGGKQRLCRLWRSPSAEPAQREFNSENVPKDEHNEPVNERQHERGKAHVQQGRRASARKGPMAVLFMGPAPDAVGSTGLSEAERFCSTK
jgi:integrase